MTKEITLSFEKKFVFLLMLTKDFKKAVITIGWEKTDCTFETFKLNGRYQ